MHVSLSISLHNKNDSCIKERFRAFFCDKTLFVTRLAAGELLQSVLDKSRPEKNPFRVLATILALEVMLFLHALSEAMSQAHHKDVKVNISYSMECLVSLAVQNVSRTLCKLLQKDVLTVLPKAFARYKRLHGTKARFFFSGSVNGASLY